MIVPAQEALSHAALDAALQSAHAIGDSRALVALYTQAADLSSAAEDTDSECFFLTHAFIFALELGDPRARDLHDRLLKHGREEQWPDQN